MRFGLLSLVAVLPATSAFGAALLAPGDAIIAIDAIPNSTSSYPGGEAPSFAFDGSVDTKYLNFGGSGTGFIVTPGYGSSVVTSLSMSTANDAPERDPLSYMLYGTNDAILSTDNSTGNGGEAWTLISGGGLTPPTEGETRKMPYPVVDFANLSAYTSYKMVFPTVGGATLMQVSEVQLHTGAGATGDSVLTNTDPVLAIDEFAAPPAAEDAPNAIDGNPGTKYLNFGEEGSGIIVTPASGPSVARSIQLTTANDAPARDATSFEIYGTNDAITSAMWGTGDDENWVLIASGAMSLPTDRGVEGPIVGFDNDTAYTSYKIVFPTIVDAAATNSFQVAEIQLFDVVPEPGSVALLGLGGLALLRRRK